MISVVARMMSVHPQTLRAYEREGLIAPARSPGGVRMFSDEDVERLRLIRRLVEELRVNLAGVDVILNLTERIEGLQADVESLREELQRQRDRQLPAPRP